MGLEDLQEVAFLPLLAAFFWRLELALVRATPGFPDRGHLVVAPDAVMVQEDYRPYYPVPLDNTVVPVLEEEVYHPEEEEVDEEDQVSSSHDENSVVVHEEKDLDLGNFPLHFSRNGVECFRTYGGHPKAFVEQGKGSYCLEEADLAQEVQDDPPVLKEDAPSLRRDEY